MEATDACLHELFQEQAARTPTRLAVDADSGTLTYAELDAAADSLAQRLRQAGARPEQLIGICLDNRPERVIAVLAVLKTGAGYVPLDTQLPEERRHLIVNDADPLLVLDDLTGLPDPDTRRCATGRTADADNAAYVMFTSGSTGVPKGVVVPHRGVVNRVRDTIHRHAVTPDDRVLHRMPFGFDGAAWELFVPLLAGATVVLGTDEAARDPQAVARLVRDRSVTVLQAVPSMLRLMTDEHLNPNGPLRLLYAAGEHLDAHTAQRVCDALGTDNLWNVYGPTECSIGCVEGPYTPGAEGSVPIGTPLAGITVRLLDAAGLPVPDGAAGELHVSGAGVARGYLGRAAATAQRFVPDPYGAPGERAYRTGDLVRRLPDGALQFIGRADGQLKVRGVRIEPEEIENALVGHPKVTAVAVAERHNRLVAYIVSGAPVAAAALRDYLSARLPADYIPSHFVALDRLPLTAAEKLDRAALPDPPATASADAPRTPDEKLVVRVWAELLDGIEAGVNDDFFQLGGYSMLVPRIAARLNQEGGAAIPVAELYQAPTVAGQAGLLARHRGATEGAHSATPTEHGALVPLSPGQHRLWFLERLEPGSREYLVPFVTQLPLPADAPSVREALHALAERHAILRTRYEVHEGRPHQVIDERPRIDLSVSHDPPAQLLSAATARGFDLESGPVWRAVLTTGGRLLLVIHHIACDGESIKILERDLRELFLAQHDKRRPRLPALPLSYADYALAQQRDLANPEFAAELGYWRTTLADLTTLDLPTHRARPAQRTGRGAVHRFTLEPDTAQRLVALGREHGATPFMTFLAGFSMLLSRLCATTDVAVGTPVAGRLHAQTDDLVGYFLNTLVLRCQMDGVTTFPQALMRAKEVAQGAFSHQRLPFEQIVEEVQPDRNLALAPLFQVMFEVTEGKEGRDDDAAMLLDQWDTAKFDLTVHLELSPDGAAAGSLEYACDLFDAADARQVADSYVRLLDAVAAGQPLAEVDLLGEAERHQVLYAWNDTARELPEACIHELVEAQVRRTPHAVALEDGTQRLTYGELDARANGLAHRLQALGVGPDVPVGVCLERSPELVIALLGILKAGGCYVPLETDFPPARVHRLLTGVGARLCLMEPGSTPPEGIQDVIVGDQRVIAPPRTAADRDHLAAVYYTSGSTGTPKGVAATHQGWTNRLLAMQEDLRLQPGEGVLQKTTVVFDDTPVECFWPLITGGRVVVLPPGAHKDPAAILRTVADHDVAVVLVVPSMLELLVDAATDERRARLGALRHIGTSGEALSPHLARRFAQRFGPQGPRLHNHWGVTEASIDSTRHPVGALDHDLPGAVPLGRPLANNRIYLLDDAMRPVPPGARGEIYVGGPVLARGYHRAAALTARAFVPDPFGTGERLYRTGDHGRQRPDGTIAFLGRRDHQFKIRGVRVELGEIETMVRSHPAVLDAAVEVRHLPSGDKRLAGFYVPRSRLSAEDLRAHLAGQLPGYLMPATLTALAEIPRTTSGKIDRARLPAADADPTASGPDLVAPRTATEEALAAIWQQVLATPVGIHHNFFRLGGHSLLAAQATMKIEERFDLEVPLRTFFEKPTVAELAAEVEDLIRAEVAQLTDDQVKAAITAGEETGA